MKNIKLFDGFLNENEYKQGEKPGLPVNNGKEDGVTLSLSFGTDQEKGIDSVLSDLKQQGFLLGLDKKIENEEAHYLLKFKTSYGVYLFGYKQAKIKPF